MNIEQDLQRALRRQPGPPDLADRVLARLHEQPTPAARPATLARLTPWLAAAAAIALVATGATRYYGEQQAQREAERAAQQLQIALQITSETLAAVQARVDASLNDNR